MINRFLGLYSQKSLFCCFLVHEMIKQFQPPRKRIAKGGGKTENFAGFPRNDKLVFNPLANGLLRGEEKWTFCFQLRKIINRF